VICDAVTPRSDAVLPWPGLLLFGPVLGPLLGPVDGPPPPGPLVLPGPVLPPGSPLLPGPVLPLGSPLLPGPVLPLGRPLLPVPVLPAGPPAWTEYWLNAESGSRVPPHAPSNTMADSAETRVTNRRRRVIDGLNWEDFTTVPPHHRGGRVGRLLHACQ
jgi:hypothetical protein